MRTQDQALLKTCSGVKNEHAGPYCTGGWVEVGTIAPAAARGKGISVLSEGGQSKRTYCLRNDHF